MFNPVEFALGDCMCESMYLTCVRVNFASEPTV